VRMTLSGSYSSSNKTFVFLNFQKKKQ
jgi:hypothetical protein